MHRSFTSSCSVHTEKNHALDQKMISTFSNGLDDLYHHAKFGGDRTMPAVGAKIWCLYVFCVFVTLRSIGPLFVRGVHSSNMYCATVNGSILMRFSTFSE